MKGSEIVWMKIGKEREFLILFKILPERIEVEPMF